MKEQRQRMILEIVQNQFIETQEQLLLALAERGLHCTQATISRDMKELHLVKEMAASGSYHYAVSLQNRQAGRADRLQNIFREGVTSFDCAQNLVVLKTMPGLANAAAAALDGMELPDMVGSLAGDDTVLLIMRTNQDAERFCGELRAMVQGDGV
ncbi:MAG: arginine repressor [Clostridiales bacterium]|nr:arginine repressor [Clostridiales bacterium]